MAVYRVDLRIKDGLLTKQVYRHMAWPKALKKLQAAGAPLRALVSYDNKSYTCKLIDGKDLWGDKPFQHESKKPRRLSVQQRLNIANLILEYIKAYQKCGYYLPDLTLRNIMLEGNTPYFIDFDDIRSFDKKMVHAKYLDNWQSTLDILKMDIKFGGNLKNLERQLREGVHRLSS